MKMYLCCLMMIVSLVASLEGAYGQTATTSASGSVVASSGSITYVVGQVTNQTEPQLRFGVLQVIETTSEALSAEPLDLDFQIFPNPTSQYLSLSHNSGSVTSLSYRVFDLEGRVVLQGIVNEREMLIDFSKQKPQVYQLMIQNENQLIKTFKIVKK
ncbi:MAG: T9SS type A sorting domain-containing protein [Ekhidna sp.]|nr:T9SS type A sorting domain-containing protein [Ekhidna sp.]